MVECSGVASSGSNWTRKSSRSRSACRCCTGLRQKRRFIATRLAHEKISRQFLASDNCIGGQFHARGSLTNTPQQSEAATGLPNCVFFWGVPIAPENRFAQLRAVEAFVLTVLVALRIRKPFAAIVPAAWRSLSRSIRACSTASYPTTTSLRKLLRPSRQTLWLSAPNQLEARPLRKFAVGRQISEHLL